MYKSERWKSEYQIRIPTYRLFEQFMKEHKLHEDSPWLGKDFKQIYYDSFFRSYTDEDFENYVNLQYYFQMYGRLIIY